jgi:hypothetical protein
MEAVRFSRLTVLLAVMLAPASGCSFLIQTNDLNAGDDDAGPLDGTAGPSGDSAPSQDTGTVGPTPDATSMADVAASDVGAGETGADAPTNDATGASDAPVDAPVEAAPTDAQVDAVADAPVDSAAPDASAPEASVDAAPEAAPDVVTTTFCASLSPAPTLCVDFDEGAAFDALFPQLQQPSAGHVGADGTQFSSPPDSFFSKIDKNALLPEAYMSHPFTGGNSGTATNIEYAFDLLFQQYVNDSNASVVRISLGRQQAWEHDLVLAVSSTGAEMEESFTTDAGLSFVDTFLSVAPAPNTWTRVDITVSLLQQTMSVKVGGVAALTNQRLDSSWAIFSGGTGSLGGITIDLGMSYAASTNSAWVMRYDNVVANLY